MAPKVYHVHPLVAGPLDNWPSHFARCRAMGFDFVGSAPLFAPGSDGDIYLTADYETLHPALGWTGSADAGIGRLADECGRHGMGLILDIVAHRVAADAPMRARESTWFEPDQPSVDPPDPRIRPHARNIAEARFDDPNGLGAWWASRLSRLAKAGAAGFRCLDPQHVPPAVWGDIIAATRASVLGTVFIAWTPGAGWSEIAALAGTGFDFVASSVAWWDARASWFLEEAAVLRTVAPSIASPEPSFTERLATRLDPEVDPALAYRRALRLAAATASGLLVPMGFEFGTRRRFDQVRADPRDFEQARQEATVDLRADIRIATELVDSMAALGAAGEMRGLTGPDSEATGLLRADAPDVRDATRAVMLAINPLLTRPASLGIPLDPLPPTAGATFGRALPFDGAHHLNSPLAPGEVRLIRYDRLAPVVQSPLTGTALQEALRAPRLVIEAVAPVVDGGAFPVKRLAGDTVSVSADIFCDGHEILAAELLWRAADEPDWRREPMKPVANDRWEAQFTPARVGRHYCTIEAW
ncbi:MAG: maltotransferase domain-containing protein, partial [Acetobacteraceae bacterium]